MTIIPAMDQAEKTHFICETEIQDKLKANRFKRISLTCLRKVDQTDCRHKYKCKTYSYL